jgi:hypothetical protein
VSEWSGDFGEAADAAVYAVIGPEQRKNSERNFFWRFFGHFVGDISVLYQPVKCGFRCYSVTAKPKRGTAKHFGDNSESQGA